MWKKSRRDPFKIGGIFTGREGRGGKILRILWKGGVGGRVGGRRED